MLTHSHRIVLLEMRMIFAWIILHSWSEIYAKNRHTSKYTVRTGFLLMSQKSLFLITSSTQNNPETKRLKFEKLMCLYLKCMLFLKVSQHVLIFETQLFSIVSHHVLIFETTCYSNVIWDVLIFETPHNYLISSHFI